MALGVGQSLTGFLELFLYSSIVLGGVPYLLHLYSVDVLGCFAGVPGNIQLFRHYSGVFCCSTSVPCSVVPCSSVPGFIVDPIK